MKLSVEFPSVSYREGPEAVRRMAQAIERIGYDHIDIFDHVVIGHPMEGRPPGPYNAAMPIIAALMGLSYIAAVTSRVTLGTEVLVPYAADYFFYRPSSDGESIQQCATR